MSVVGNILKTIGDDLPAVLVKIDASLATKGTSLQDLEAAASAMVAKAMEDPAATVLTVVVDGAEIAFPAQAMLIGIGMALIQSGLLKPADWTAPVFLANSDSPYADSERAAAEKGQTI